MYACTNLSLRPTITVCDDPPSGCFFPTLCKYSHTWKTWTLFGSENLTRYSPYEIFMFYKRGSRLHWPCNLKQFISWKPGYGMHLLGMKLAAPIHIKNALRLKFALRNREWNWRLSRDTDTNEIRFLFPAYPLSSSGLLFNIFVSDSDFLFCQITTYTIDGSAHFEVPHKRLLWW